MNRVCYLIFVCCFFSVSYGQQSLDDSISMHVTEQNKPLIDTSIYDNWASATLAKISSCGRYCCYTIEVGNSKIHTLILQAISERWKIQSTLKGWYSFTDNGTQVVWVNSNDSLCICALGRDEMFYVPNVLSFSLSDNYITYQLTTDPDRYIVRNLATRKIDDNLSMSRWFMSIGNSKMLILKQTESGEQTLWLFSGRGNRSILWRGKGVRMPIQDNEHHQIVFTTDSTGSDLWYFKYGMSKVDHFRISLENGARLSGSGYFSKDGKQVFVDVLECDSVGYQPGQPIVNIWNYTDNELLSQQQKRPIVNNYITILNIPMRRLWRLTEKRDWVYLPRSNDTVVLIRHQEIVVPGDEVGWNVKGKYSWFLTSVNDGSRVRLTNLDKENEVMPEISPTGKFVLYLSKSDRQYYVYQTNTHEVRCISRGPDEDWMKDINKGSYGRSIVGWETDDRAVLVCGQRDIWRIDPLAKVAPVNLTNGYGQKHNIVFFPGLEQYSHRPIRRDELLILSAFNLET